MIILKFTDFEFIYETMGIFRSTSYISFQIDYENMKISSNNNYSICLSISNLYFNISKPISFVINSKHFFMYIKKLEVDFIVLDDFFEIVGDENVRAMTTGPEIEFHYQKLLKNENTAIIDFSTENKDKLFKKFIKIPFVKVEVNCPVYDEEIKTKFIVESKAIKHFPLNDCTYSISDKLIIKLSTNTEDESYEIPIEAVINERHIFKCKNSWVKGLIENISIIKHLMFFTTESSFSVKCFIKDEYYYELVIPIKI